MAFSQYEADFPELRTEWWQARSHHAPLGVSKPFKAMVAAIEHYQNQVTFVSGDDSTALHEVIDRIHDLERTGMPEAKKKDQKGSMVKNKRSPKAFNFAGSLQSKHKHFYLALVNLEKICKDFDLGYVPKEYSDF